MSADEIGKKTFNRTLRAASLALLLLVVPSAALAAISATDLTAGGAAGSNITTATTNSFSPGANQLILAWVVSHDNNTPIVPTSVSGNGLAWTSVTGASWNFSGGKTHDQMTLYRAMGASPTPGSVTISYSQAQQSISWSIVEFSGVDTSGTDGSGAVKQFIAAIDNAAGPSGLTLTLNLAIGSGNATAGGFGNTNALAASISPGAGYTAFSEVYVSATQSDLRAEWRPDGNRVVDATQSGSFPMGGIAVEIRAAGAPALALVKQIWDSAGSNCLASIPADATCNGSATSVTVPGGTALMMLIYVRNTNSTAVTDVRFQDLLDDSVTGFTYTASSIKQTPNDGTAPADTASNATILAAATIAQTDAVGAPDDFASITDSNANGQLDTLTVGAVTGQANQSLAFQANKTFAIVFSVAKN